MSAVRRRLLVVLVVTLAIALVAWLVRPRPIAVDVAAVRRGPMQVVLEEQGETRVEPRFVVSAPVGGRLLRPALRAGDAVRRGDLVAAIAVAPLDPRADEQARAALVAAQAGKEEADARVAEARATHRQAVRNRERLEHLAAAGQLAAADLDEARTQERATREALDAAHHRAEAAAGQVAAARAVVDEVGAGDGVRRVPLASPADGRVLRVFEPSERVVPAGTPILEVGDPARLEVVVEVLSTDAVALAAGTRMLLDVGAGAPLPARLRHVEPAAFTKVSPLGVEEQRVRAVGDVEGDARGVGDRYRVEAQLVLWQSDGTLQAPIGAVFRRGDGWAVFVAADGRARLRAVEIGHRNAAAAEVRAGLRDGERVVLYPPERLDSGDRIAVEER
jgi:HlyD family secretion protein